MPVRSLNDVSIPDQFRFCFGDDVNPFFFKVFGLPTDVVGATLGDVGVQEVVELATGVSPHLQRTRILRFPCQRRIFPIDP